MILRRLQSCRCIAACTVLLLVLAVVFGSHRAIGQTEGNTMATRFNVPLPTTGGSQFWSDLIHRDGYRIQRNELTGHYRLLDPRNVRRGWGSEDDVLTLLEQYCPTPSAPDAKPIVVLLHGLIRTDTSMKPLELALNSAGYKQTIRFGYASTRSALGQSAANLRRVLEGQHPQAEFCFVGHSMGNIVLRHLLGDLVADGDPANILPRCRGMVMLGPPNQGATIARRLAMTGLFEFVAGPGAMELGPRWSEVADRLATPTFPFAIVAGKVATGPVRNPLVDGDSDFVVSLEEAQLEGAEAIQEFPVLHSFLMNDEAVQKWTIEFLDSHLQTHQE